MEQTQRRLALIGLFALLTLAGTVALYGYMKGQNLFRTEHRYYVRFNYVDGLYISNRVLLNGMRIGLVSAIDFAPDNSGWLVVELTVPSRYRLQKETTAQIVNTGLIGGRMVRLNRAVGPGPYLADGDTLRGITDPSYAEMMETDMRPIVANADSLLRNLRALTSTLALALTPQTPALVNGSLQHLHGSLRALHSAMDELPALMAQARSVADRADSSMNSLNGAMLRIAGLADTLQHLPLRSLASRLDSAAITLNLVLHGIQSGQGTVGRLVANDSLYLQLQRATGQIDSLANDIRNNPKRYVHFSLF